MKPLTIYAAAEHFGTHLEPPGKRSHCPFRQHKRGDKTFNVFVAASGTMLFKCFACDGATNVGDAVQFVANLEGVDRREACRRLRRLGFDIPPPGAASRGTVRRPAAVASPRRNVTSQPRSALAPQRWAQLQSMRTGAVERFGAKRDLSPEVLRAHDVFDVDAMHIGFGYRDPVAGSPCRVKVRSLTRKTFYIEPKGAPAPLYLAHRLDAHLSFAVIVEGEVDAITLTHLEIPNVVSLPDGVPSAPRVDLHPIARLKLWVLITDADKVGDEAAATLRDRAMKLGIGTTRVFIRDACETYKDANDAHCRGVSKHRFAAIVRAAIGQANDARIRVPAQVRPGGTA